MAASEGYLCLCDETMLAFTSYSVNIIAVVWTCEFQHQGTPFLSIGVFHATNVLIVMVV